MNLSLKNFLRSSSSLSKGSFVGWFICVGLLLDLDELGELGCCATDFLILKGMFLVSLVFIVGGLISFEVFLTPLFSSPFETKRYITTPTTHNITGAININIDIF